jgi:hypothetical protein
MKQAYLAKVAEFLGAEILDPAVRRRALGFMLRGWQPQGAAAQIRLEQEPL